MIAELGHFTLILAFLVLRSIQAIVPQSSAPGVGPRPRLMQALSAPAALMQLALGLLGSFASLLIWLYVTSDFSVANVAANSHSEKPLIYKITGVGETTKAR